MSRVLQSVTFIIPIGLMALTLVGCSSTKDNFGKRYEKAWKEVVKSQAWKDALHKNEPSSGAPGDFYVSNDDMGVLKGRRAQHSVGSADFKTYYNQLVLRAYAKIIAQAEEADSRLEHEYAHWNTRKEHAKNMNDKAFHDNYSVIDKRYKAHRKMLAGLKSWNIFSEYGTADLAFFKAEYADKVRQMHQNGLGEGNIIGFLVYKLADLYHTEE